MSRALIETGTTGPLIGRNERPGIVSEYLGDCDDVAKAALGLIEHPERLKPMAAASSSRATALCDIGQSALAAAQIFRKLLPFGRELARIHSVS